MTVLPWLPVRYLLARKSVWGWRLDLLSVLPWLAYYYTALPGAPAMSVRNEGLA